MKYCPECGKNLMEEIINKKIIKKCDCGFIDWDNWVNISAVVVAYNSNNEFLMVKLKGKEKGKLTFPGGYRDLYETIEEAAIRECFEETGYIINDLSLFKIYTRDDIRLVWIVYKAKITGGNFIENSETESIAFYSKNNLPKIENLRGDLTSRLLHDIINCGN